MWTLAIALALAATGNYEIDSFRYGSDAEARVAWKAMFGSRPVEALSAMPGKEGLKLPCDMTGPLKRAAWDRSIKTDLSKADKFTFQFYVDDPRKLATYFSLYFESGDGWYAAAFPAAKGWNAISLDKAQFGKEGDPQGWSQIKTIRISAWKSIAAVTYVAIADLVAVASDTVVVLGDRTPKDAGEWQTVEATAKFVTKTLGDIGVDSGVITDTDVEQGSLEGRKAAVFPHNPNITDKEMDAIEAFVQRGGKVIAFYSVPTRLLKALGLESKGYRRQNHEGEFASIRFPAPAITGMPAEVKQASWNINLVAPAAKNAKIVGEWYDAKGNPTNLPAVAVSDTGAYMGHVLLSDDLPGKRRLMLALLGRSDPGLWQKASRRAIEAAPIVGECKNKDQVYDFVTAAKRPQATSHLAKALDLLKQAEKAKPEQALDKAEQARKEFTAAYCAAAPPKPGEMRAVWCHSAAGVPGKTWDEVVKALKDGGVTMLMPNMLWGGRAYYKSVLLPVDESVAKDGDRIAECAAAGKKHGVQVHVWKVNWNLQNAPRDFLAKMRTEQRTQRDPDGGDIDWLCPSNPLNFELERDSMLEVAKNYDVAGLHFDYIRYPDDRGCFCDGCRERFERQYKVKVERWPAQVVSGDLHLKYLEFRQNNITRLVKSVAEEARKIKPGIKISAAVFSNWPQCADWVGQDWVKWVKEGYVDFVCPMDYTDSAAQFDTIVASQMANTAHAKPIIPGIGVTLGEWTLTPDQVVRQILIARKHGADGFTLFNLDRYVLDELLPALRTGATR